MFGIFRRKSASTGSRPSELELKERGNQFLAKGEWREAEACFRQAVAANAEFVPGHVNLGFVLNEQGRRDEARRALDRAVSLDPTQADAWYLLGTIARAEGELDVAVDKFKRALAANPGLDVAYPQLFQVLFASGHREEARAVLVDGLAINSRCPNLNFFFGNLLASELAWDAAADHFRKEVEVQPGLVDAHNNLGITLQALGEIDAAIAAFRNALALNPESANAHCNLGSALEARGEHGLAIEHFRHALAARPDFAAAHHNMGSVLLKLGDANGAIACYDAALRLEPENADAHLNLGTAYRVLGQAEMAIRSFRRAMAIDPDSPAARNAHGNLLYASADVAPAEYLSEAQRYGASALARATPYVDWHSASAERPLRIGFVSGDLRMHPVGYFLEGVLARLSLRSLTLIAYSTTLAEDALTARIKPRFSHWNVIANLSDEDAARKIRDDQVDILVDLAGHTADNRLSLFAWKPAPLQISWLGYWASTGVPGIDYFLADAISVPAGNDAHFSESIWRLPETRLCFTPPDEKPRLAVSPPPAMRNGYVTFGCYQHMAKVSAASLAVWGRILRAQPDARLRLQDRHLGYPMAREQLQRRLTDTGVAAERVAMHGSMPREDYLATYADVDIVLDTFPYSGGTTTCEGLWMGVPTLTMAGQTLIARQGASMLTCVGLQGWVADSEEAYVAKALRFAADVGGLAELRATLRERALGSPLFDANRFARHLEEALRAMWRSKMAS